MAKPAINALASGLRDGGCAYVTNYPGSYSQDIFFSLGGTRISINERTAFEMAYGASLAGKRSVVTMKNVGVNACADPFLHATIAGVRGGFVVIISDDTKVVGSQEREDSRHYMDFFGGLWLEPSNLQMGYDMAYDAFSLSEELDMPVVIRLTNQYFDQTGNYTPRKPSLGTKGVANNPEKFIVYPTYWRQQWENLKVKQRHAERYVAGCYKDQSSTSGQKQGVIVIGACEEELKAGKYNNCDVARVNMYPLPSEYIRHFVSGRPKITVLEQGDAYAAREITLQLAKPTIPLIVESDTGHLPDLSHQWITWNHLEKLFQGLASIKPSFVIGDVGQYTVETTGTVGACLCLGSSVGTALGMAQAGIDYPFCIVGDGAFMHSCVPAPTEAQTRDAKFGIVIIDNGGSAATGGQPLIADVHTAINDGIACHTMSYADATEEEFADRLSQMRTNKKLAVLAVKLAK